MCSWSARERSRIAQRVTDKEIEVGGSERSDEKYNAAVQGKAKGRDGEGGEGA